MMLLKQTRPKGEAKEQEKATVMNWLMSQVLLVEVVEEVEDHPLDVNQGMEWKKVKVRLRESGR